MRPVYFLRGKFTNAGWVFQLVTPTGIIQFKTFFKVALTHFLLGSTGIFEVSVYINFECESISWRALISRLIATSMEQHGYKFMLLTKIIIKSKISV